MNNGLTQLTSHRLWVVPNFIVWGLSKLGVIEYLNLEQVDSTVSAAFGSVNIGDSTQSVSFAGLTDLRGNTLPSIIKRPLVTIRSHSEANVFIVGSETESTFKIARDPSSDKPVVVDLIVVELGE